MAERSGRRPTYLGRAQRCGSNFRGLHVLPTRLQRRILNRPSSGAEGLILVCDDDPGIRVVVAEQLRQHGYDILEAGSGEEVISIAKQRSSQAGLRHPSQLFCWTYTCQG